MRLLCVAQLRHCRDDIHRQLMVFANQCRRGKSMAAYRGSLVTLCMALNFVPMMLPSRLQAETLRWKCTYTSIATPKGLASENFALEFALDNFTGKAVIIGNAGMCDADVLGGSQGLTFKKPSDGRGPEHHHRPRWSISSQQAYIALARERADALAILRAMQPVIGARSRRWCPDHRVRSMDTHSAI
jgi:hypothetical protein